MLRVSVCRTAEPVDWPFSPDALLLNARCSGDVKESAQEVACSSSVQGPPWEKRKGIWMEEYKNKEDNTPNMRI